MRPEESVPHPLWLIGLRLAVFFILPVAYFMIVLGAGWFTSFLVVLLGWLFFEVSGRIRFRRSDRSVGFAWTLPWQRTQRQHLWNLAIALITIPPIMLFPLTIGFFVDPLWPFEDRDSFTMFMLFYGAPWALGAFLLYRHFTTATASSQGTTD